MATESDALDKNARVQRLRSLISAHQSDAWDKAWHEGTTPWDAGTVQPALMELVKSGEVPFLRKGRALVPGCGRVRSNSTRGYDAVYIATELGLDTLGVDLSPLAVEAAKLYAQSQVANDSTEVSFKAVDFFAFNITDEERFDLIYDYTFFCAIPPNMRAAWAQKMTFLAKPGALLVTLVFPMDGEREGGPPHSVAVSSYEEVLGCSWEKIVDRVPGSSSESHRGRERIAIWKRLS